jgi:hypothetical protein
MDSSMIEILTMLGSWVSGIGAVSAVIYAMRANQPKLNAIVSSTVFNDEGDFTLDVFNNKAITAHISHIRLVPKDLFLKNKFHPTKFSRHSIIKSNQKRQSERLNIECELGAYKQFEFSGQSLLNAYCEFCDISKPNKMMRMVKAQIVIYLTNGSKCYIDLPKSQYQKIKNAMLIPITRSLSESFRVGIYNNFPADYSNERKDSHIINRLVQYEYAYKRHLYVQLPKGITLEHFFNNE